MERTEAENCDFIHVHKDVAEKVQSHLPAEEELLELSGFFKVFGDATRIKILCILLQSEMCVCDLAQTLNMTQSAISHQLRMLRDAKLVTSRREGRSIYYSLCDEHVRIVLETALEHIGEEE